MIIYTSPKSILSSIKILFKSAIILLISIFIIMQHSYADFNGRVVKVIDGDTVDVLKPNFEKIRVRLSDIDAPERGQPYGNQAKKQLLKLVAEKNVFVKENQKDIYQRTLGTIFYNNKNINAKMVEMGYAWAYRYKNVANNLKMVELETKAKQARRGLWRDKNPIAPWTYRHNKKHPQVQHKKRLFVFEIKILGIQ